MEKTLKISGWVHRELKMYVAKNGDNMTTFSDGAILSMLQTKGHKFTTPKPASKIKSKK